MSPLNTSLGRKEAAEADWLMASHKKISSLPTPPAQMAKQQSYKAQLEAQMEDNRRRKEEIARAEAEAERKLELDIQAYLSSPARNAGGGGSPLRNASGNVMANLRESETQITRSSPTRSPDAKPSWYTSPTRTSSSNNNSTAQSENKYASLLKMEAETATDLSSSLRTELRAQSMRASQHSISGAFNEDADRERRRAREMEAQAELLKQIELKKMAKQAEQARQKEQDMADLQRIQEELHDMYLKDQEEKQLARATSALGQNAPTPASPSSLSRPSTYAAYEALQPKDRDRVRADAERDHQAELLAQIEDKKRRKREEADKQAAEDARANARFQRDLADATSLGSSRVRNASPLPPSQSGPGPTDYRLAPLIGSPGLARGRALHAAESARGILRVPRAPPPIPKPKASSPMVRVMADSDRKFQAARELEAATEAADAQIRELRSLRADMAAEEAERNRRRAARSRPRMPPPQQHQRAPPQQSQRTTRQQPPMDSGGRTTPSAMAALSSLPPLGSPPAAHRAAEAALTPGTSSGMPVTPGGPLDFMKRGLEEDLARYGLLSGYSPAAHDDDPNLDSL